MQTVYYTLILIFLFTTPGYSQRSNADTLNPRPVSIVPMVRDLLKHEVDVNREWERTDISIPNGKEINSFVLYGRYLAYPLVNDRLHVPAMVLTCRSGRLVSAVLRVHGHKDTEEHSLVLRTDRKNVPFKASFINGNVLIGPHYAELDISLLMGFIMKSSTASIDALGLGVRFDMPIRPVGIDSACRLR